jgi:hypothetical protein
MEKIINLCPHDLVLHEIDGTEKVIKPSGLARVEAKFVQDRVFCGVADGHTEYGLIEGLPSPQEGVLYVASKYVLDAALAAGRNDVRVPTDTVRDPKTGHVLFAKGISRS